MKTSKIEKQLTFRKANASDIQMMQLFLFEHGQNEWNFLPEDDVKAHIAKIATQEVAAFLAEINNECIGLACFYFGIPEDCKKYEENSMNKTAYLSEIVVHRNHAGQGIGGRLINTLLNYLIDNGITRLYAERHADNPGSAGVMHKTGFEIVDEYHDLKRRPTGSQRTTVLRVELKSKLD